MSDQGELCPWRHHIAVPGNTAMAFFPAPVCCCLYPNATFSVSLTQKSIKAGHLDAISIPLSLKAVSLSGGPGGKEMPHFSPCCLDPHLCLHLDHQRHNKIQHTPLSKHTLWRTVTSSTSNTHLCLERSEAQSVSKV